MHPPTKVACIGTEAYSFELLRRCAMLPESITVVVASSQSPSSPEAAWCRERGIKVVGGVDELLEVAGAQGVKVIINPTPIHLHFPFSLRFIEAGFDVWMEKPPCATIQDLDALAEAAKNLGRRVSVGFNALYSRQLRSLKQEILADQFGELHSITSAAALVRKESYFCRNAWAGQLLTGDRWVLDGSLNNPLAHLFASTLFLGGSTERKMASPKTVEAELYHANRIATEDTACVRIKTDRGLRLMVLTTLAPDGNEISPVTRLECERAVIEITDFTKISIAWRDGRTETRDGQEDDRMEMLSRLALQTLEGSVYDVDVETTRPFVMSINSAFEACLPRGIDAKHVRRAGSPGQEHRMIHGVNDVIQQCFSDSCLFSELPSAPWARAGGKFTPAAYRFFPSHNPDLIAMVHQPHPNENTYV